MRYQNQKITKNYKFTGLIRLYFGQKSVKKCTKKRMIAERLIAEISKIPQSKVTSLKSPKKRLFLQLCVLHSSIIYVRVLGLKNTVSKIRPQKYRLKNTASTIRPQQYDLKNTASKIRPQKYHECHFPLKSGLM